MSIKTEFDLRPYSWKIRAEIKQIKVNNPHPPKNKSTKTTQTIEIIYANRDNTEDK